jgi:hypothetical protein
MQRIRYGLTGLALVFLIVLLGTAIIRSGGGADEGNSVNVSEPSDPLGELGVAPGQSDGENVATGNSAR